MLSSRANPFPSLLPIIGENQVKAAFLVWVHMMVTGTREREHLTLGETEMEEDVWQRQATRKQTISL